MSTQSTTLCPCGAPALCTGYCSHCNRLGLVASEMTLGVKLAAKRSIPVRDALAFVAQLRRAGNHATALGRLSSLYGTQVSL